MTYLMKWVHITLHQCSGIWLLCRTPSMEESDIFKVFISQMLRISQKSNAGFDLARCFMKFGRFHSHFGSEQLAEAIDLSGSSIREFR